MDGSQFARLLVNISIPLGLAFVAAWPVRDYMLGVGFFLGYWFGVMRYMR